jgi:hypothetical protein
LYYLFVDRLYRTVDQLEEARRLLEQGDVAHLPGLTPNIGTRRPENEFQFAVVCLCARYVLDRVVKS